MMKNMREKRKEEEEIDINAALAQINKRKELLLCGEIYAPGHETLNTNSGDVSPEHERKVSPAKTKKIAVQGARPQQKLIWISKHVVVYDSKTSTEREEGMIEYNSTATLYDVRGLINRFILHPVKKEFTFVDPITRESINIDDERHIKAMSFPYIAILLDERKKEKKVLDTLSQRQIQAFNDFIKRKLIEKDSTPKPYSPPKVERVIESKPPPTVPTFQDFSLKNQIMSGVLCDIMIRVYSDRKSVGIKAMIKDGAFENISTVFKQISENEVRHLLTLKEAEWSFPNSINENQESLIKKLALHLPEKDSGVPFIMVKQSKHTKPRLNPTATPVQDLEVVDISSKVREEILADQNIEFSLKKLYKNIEEVSKDDLSLQEADELILPLNQVEEIEHLAELETDNKVELIDIDTLPIQIDSIVVSQPPDVAPESNMKSLSSEEQKKEEEVILIDDKVIENVELLQVESATLPIADMTPCMSFIHEIFQVLQSEFSSSFHESNAASSLGSSLYERHVEISVLLVSIQEIFLLYCEGNQESLHRELRDYLRWSISQITEKHQVDLGESILLHFERNLRLICDIAGWDRLEMAHLKVFEIDNSGFLSLANLKASSLHISTKERTILEQIKDNISTLESPILDALEIFYLLLYSSSNKPKSKLKVLWVIEREERVSSVLGKVLAMDTNTFRKLELYLSDVEDLGILQRLKQLFVSFNNGFTADLIGNKTLVSSPILNGIVTMVIAKSIHMNQSISHWKPQENLAGRNTLISEWLKNLDSIIVDEELSSCETHLRNIGTKVFLIHKLNQVRSSHSLPSIFLDSKASVTARQQSYLISSDKEFAFQSRWNQQQMKSGELNRYTFTGPSNVLMEFVYVRNDIDCIEMGNSWDENDSFCEKEMQKALSMFQTMDISSRQSLFMGIGINSLHLEFYPYGFSKRLFSLLEEHEEISSLSFGYYVNYDEDEGYFRFIFRLHTTLEDQSRPREYPIDSKSLNALLDRHNSIEHYMKFNILEFLKFELHDARSEKWKMLPFGERIFNHLEIHYEGIILTDLKVFRAIYAILDHFPCPPTVLTKQIICDMFHFLSLSKDELGYHVITAFDRMLITNKGNDLGIHSFTDIQRKFVHEDGLRLLARAAEQNINVPYTDSLQNMILSLLMTKELCCKEGITVHCKEWTNFYLEKGGVERYQTLSKKLLQEIHDGYFYKSFEEVPRILCKCGCSGVNGSLKSLEAVFNLYFKLLLSESGAIWAQEDDMPGIMDCLKIITSETVSFHKSIKLEAMQTVQTLASDKLKSIDRILSCLNIARTTLLPMLKTFDDSGLQLEVFRVASCLLGLSIERSVWKASMTVFLQFLYDLLGYLCHQEVALNDSIVSNLFLDRVPRAQTESKGLKLLFDEHLSPKGKSVLSRLIQLLEVKDDVQRLSRGPIMVSFFFILSHPSLYQECASLQVDDIFIKIFEDANPFNQILASRVLTVFYVHAAQDKYIFDEAKLRRVCNHFTVSLNSHARIFTVHENESKTLESIILLSGSHEYYPIIELHQESISNSTKTDEKEPIDCSDQWIIENIWRRYSWGISGHEQSEKITSFVTLLGAFSCLTLNIRRIAHSPELKEVLLLMMRFVKDRPNAPEDHLLLYLYSLRNIIFAIRDSFRELGLIAFSDVDFIKKLLVYARRRTILQEFASGVLWALSCTKDTKETFFQQFLIEFEHSDELLIGISFNKDKTLNGIGILSENISGKISSKLVVESDAATLSFLILDKACGSTYFQKIGNAFAIRQVQAFVENNPLITNQLELAPDIKTFGPALMYPMKILKKDRELFQLCRLVRSSVIVALRESKLSVICEMGRLRSVMGTLIGYSSVLIQQEALRTFIVVMKAFPSKGQELLDYDGLQRVVSIAFEAKCETLQATAFKCLRHLMPSHEALYQRLFNERERLLPHFMSKNFSLRKQVLILALDIFTRLESAVKQKDFSSMFATPENQNLLTEMFLSLSIEFQTKRKAGDILMLLANFAGHIIDDLIVGNHSEPLVDALCRTLLSARSEPILRPTICNCLAKIVLLGGKACFFAKKSRINVITELLTQQLTIGELRKISLILTCLCEEDARFVIYLSSQASQCIKRVCAVLNSFTDAAEDVNLSHMDEQYFLATASTGSSTAEEFARIKIMVPERSSYICHYTEDIYAKFLILLHLLLSNIEFQCDYFGCQCNIPEGCQNCDSSDLIAKAQGGRLICRFLFSKRILAPRDAKLSYFRGISGTDSTELIEVCLKILEKLSFNQSNRAEIIRGSTDLQWVTFLIDRCKTPYHDEDLIRAIMCLSRFFLEKESVEEHLIKRELPSILNSVLTQELLKKDGNICLIRACLFGFSRLSESRRLLRTQSFQDKIGAFCSIIHRLDDPISIANILSTFRNSIIRLKYMRSVIADERIFKVVGALLKHQDDNDVEPEIRAASQILAVQFIADTIVLSKSTKKEAISDREIESPNSLEEAKRVFLGSVIVRQWSSRFKNVALDEISSAYLDENLTFAILSGLGGIDQWDSDSFFPLLNRILSVCQLTDSEQPSSLDHRNEHLELENDDNIFEIPIEIASRQPRPCSFLTFSSPSEIYYGSSNLWKLIRVLLTHAREKSYLDRVDKDLIAKIPSSIEKWKSSMVIRDGRWEFLRAVYDITQCFPFTLGLLNMESVFSTIEMYSNKILLGGKGFDLVQSLLGNNPKHILWLNNHLIMKNTALENKIDHISRGFLSISRALKADTMIRRVIVPKTLEDESAKVILLHESLIPAYSSITFVVSVVSQIIRKNRSFIPWFASIQGFEVVSDILLAESFMPWDSRISLRHSMINDLLDIILRTIQYKSDYHETFLSDPRLLAVTLSHLFSFKQTNQEKALQILVCLSSIKSMRKSMRAFQVLDGNPVSSVDASIVDGLRRHLERKNLRTLNYRDLRRLAHVMRVPIFADLKMSELLKLSACFIESKTIESDSFMIIENEAFFSAIPSWMIEKCGVGMPKINFGTPVATFQRLIDQKKRVAFSGSFVVYLVRKDAFIRWNSLSTRTKVVRRILSYCDQENKAKDLRADNRYNRPFLVRLSRLLVEPYAELIRKVSTSKKILPNEIAPIANKSGTIFSALKRLPIFDGIPGEKLASLAYALSHPSKEMKLGELQTGKAYLLLTETCVSQPAEIASLNQRLKKGSIVGFSGCLLKALNSSKDSIQQNSIFLQDCQGILLEYDIMLKELGEKALNLCASRISGGEVEEIRLTEPSDDRSISDSNQMVALRVLLSLSRESSLGRLILSEKKLLKALIEIAMTFCSSSSEPALQVIHQLMSAKNGCLIVCGYEVSIFRQSNDACPVWARDIVFLYALSDMISQWSLVHHVAIQIFRIYIQALRYFPNVACRIELLFSLKFLERCCQMLRHGDNYMAKTVAILFSHVLAIQPLFIVEKAPEIKLHVGFTEAIQMHMGEVSPHLLQIFVSLYRHLPLRSDMLMYFSHHDDHQVFPAIFSSLYEQFKLPSRLRSNFKIKSICDFLQVLCVSGIENNSDSKYRKTIGQECGILRLLVQHVADSRSHEELIIPTIWKICYQDMDNACDAAFTTLLSPRSKDKRFVDYIYESLALYLNDTTSVVRLEGLLKCIGSLSIVPSCSEIFGASSSLSIITLYFTGLASLRGSRECVQIWSAALQALKTILSCNPSSRVVCNNHHLTSVISLFVELSEQANHQYEDEILMNTLADSIVAITCMATDSSFVSSLLSDHSNSLLNQFLEYVCYWITQNHGSSIASVMFRQIRQELICLLSDLCRHEQLALLIGEMDQGKDLLKHIIKLVQATEMDSTFFGNNIKLLCFYADHYKTQDRGDLLCIWKLFPLKSVLKTVRSSSHCIHGYAVRLLWLGLEWQEIFFGIENCEKIDLLGECLQVIVACAKIEKKNANLKFFAVGCFVKVFELSSNSFLLEDSQDSILSLFQSAWELLETFDISSVSVESILLKMVSTRLDLPSYILWNVNAIKFGIFERTVRFLALLYSSTTFQGIEKLKRSLTSLHSNLILKCACESLCLVSIGHVAEEVLSNSMKLLYGYWTISKARSKLWRNHQRFCLRYHVLSHLCKFFDHSLQKSVQYQALDCITVLVENSVEGAAEMIRLQSCNNSDIYQAIFSMLNPDFGISPELEEKVWKFLSVTSEYSIANRNRVFHFLAQNMIRSSVLSYGIKNQQIALYRTILQCQVVNESFLRACWKIICESTFNIENIKLLYALSLQDGCSEVLYSTWEEITGSLLEKVVCVINESREMSDLLWSTLANFLHFEILATKLVDSPTIVDKLLYSAISCIDTRGGRAFIQLIMNCQEHVFVHSHAAKILSNNIQKISELSRDHQKFFFMILPAIMYKARSCRVKSLIRLDETFWKSALDLIAQHTASFYDLYGANLVGIWAFAANTKGRGQADLVAFRQKLVKLCYQLLDHSVREHLPTYIPLKKASRFGSSVGTLLKAKASFRSLLQIDHCQDALQESPNKALVIPLENNFIEWILTLKTVLLLGDESAVLNTCYISCCLGLKGSVMESVYCDRINIRKYLDATDALIEALKCGIGHQLLNVFCCLPSFLKLFGRMINLRNDYSSTCMGMLALLKWMKNMRVSASSSEILQSLNSWDMCILSSIWVNTICSDDIGSENFSEWEQKATICSLLEVGISDDAFAQSVLKSSLLDHLMSDVEYVCNTNSLTSSVSKSVLGVYVKMIQRFGNDDIPSKLLFAKLRFMSRICWATFLAVGSSSVNAKKFSLMIMEFLCRTQDGVVAVFDALPSSKPGASWSDCNILLQAFSDAVLQQIHDHEIVAVGSFVISRLCQSPLGIKPFVLSRMHLKRSFKDVLYLMLLETESQSRLLKIPKWKLFTSIDAYNFLPHLVSDVLQEASLHSLQTLSLFIKDQHNFDATRLDTIVFERLFVALGSRNMEISMSAGCLLVALIKTFGCLENIVDHVDNGHDIVDTDSTVHHRRLKYFTSISKHEIISELNIPVGNIPWYFRLLVRWVKFYSFNPELWDDKMSSVDDLQKQQIYHFKHLLRILELLIYILTNYFTQVFEVLQTDPIEVEEHTLLCGAAFSLLTEKRLQKSDYVGIRVKALRLLIQMCPWKEFQYPVDFFADMVIIESLINLGHHGHLVERKLVLQLLVSITSCNKVKDIFVENLLSNSGDTIKDATRNNSSFLLKIISWLGARNLQPIIELVMKIIKNLATRSHSKDPRHEIFYQNLALLLCSPNQECKWLLPQRNIIAYRIVELDITETFMHTASANEQGGGVYVKVNIQLEDSHEEVIREFQLRCVLKNAAIFKHHLFVDNSITRIQCRFSFVCDEHSRKTKSNSLRHRLSSSTKSQQKSKCMVENCNCEIMMTISHSEASIDDAIQGVLGQCLIENSHNGVLLQDSVETLSELCKSHEIFCNSEIKIPEMLLWLCSQASSVLLRDKLLMICLESISSWFWSKPTGLFFTTSMVTITKLVQMMRLCGISLKPGYTKSARNQMELKTLSDKENVVPARNFLKSLIDWMAAMDNALIENYINILFFENPDVIIYWCTQYFGDREALGSFLELISSAIRTNIGHCEAFTRKHAIRFFLTIVDHPIMGDVRKPCASWNFAARIMLKLVRAPSAREKFIKNSGMIFFGKLSHRVLCLSHGKVRQEAAESLVISTAFLYERLVSKCTYNDDDLLILKGMVLRTGKASTISPLELLLFYLGDNESKSDEPGESLDRLAAFIISGLVERFPDREIIHNHVREILDCPHNGDILSPKEHHEILLRAVRKCITLTQWQYECDLHIVQRAYYTQISEGVRTGIISPECRHVFHPYEKEHWVQDSNYGNDGNLRSNDSSSLQNEMERAQNVLRAGMLHVEPFAREHSRLVETLVENRKRGLLEKLEVADRNARVLFGIQATLSLLMDLYFELRSGLGSFEDYNKSTVFQRWIDNIEELGALVCSCLHELDLTYYAGLMHQLHHAGENLVNLLRSERNSIHPVVLQSISKFNTILKKIIHPHTLKGVGPNGVKISDDAKSVFEKIDEEVTKKEIIQQLVEILNSKEANEKLSRTLFAIEYLWSRVMMSYSLKDFMVAETDKLSLLDRLKIKFGVLKTVLANPNMYISSILSLIRGKLELIIGQRSRNTTTFQNTIVRGSKITPGSTPSGGKSLLTRGLNHTSEFPFCSRELLLDHYGFASLGSKKVLELMTRSKKDRSEVLLMLSKTFKVDEKKLEHIPLIRLELAFQKLRLRDFHKCMSDLRIVAQNANVGVQVPILFKQLLEIKLWRFLARPIQRIRLLHLLHIILNYNQSNSGLHTIHHKNEDSSIQSSNHKEGLDSSKSFQLINKSLIISQKSRKLTRKTSKTAPELSMTSFISTNGFDDHILYICDKLSSIDPLSDEMAVSRLAQQKRTVYLHWLKSSSRKYQLTAFVSKTLERILRLILFICFWRRGELQSDLKNQVLCGAFDDEEEYRQYFMIFHVRKGLGELIRIWMPESGTLGLSLWQHPLYLIIGVSICSILAFVVPSFRSNVDERNELMSKIVFSYVAFIIALSAISIASLARKHFVVQVRPRLRLLPVGTYYQNFIALFNILLEIVQLNSLSFDPTIQWNETDQIPKIVQWLGNSGITQFGISKVELKAILCFFALVFWFFLLKCANKFQETNIFLNRLLTKDIPSIINGVMYMGLISTFFSFLSCVDCHEYYGEKFVRCQAGSDPFLLSHQNITCWTNEHSLFAFLGLLGVTFFLPIGLLAQGMSQVLFQQETLDIKFAPVIVLLSQLIKAMTSTVKAFYTFDPMILASLGLAGNITLCVMMMAMKSSSLSYIKYIKSGIYAASSWSAACAIYRLQLEDKNWNFMSLIYFGWLSVAGVTVMTLLLKSWRASTHQRNETIALLSQRLVDSTSSLLTLSFFEKKFLAEANHGGNSVKAIEFMKKAQELSIDDPPPGLDEFIRKSKTYNGQSSQMQTIFLRSSRQLARKLESN